MNAIAERQKVATFDVGDRAVVKSTELKIAEGLPFEHWLEMVESSLAIENGSRWWVGDLISYGSWAGYGAQFAEALERLELHHDAVRDYAYVAGKVPASIRRTDLSWSHHRMVARLTDVNLQESWLQKAADGNWSSRRLAGEIIASESGVPYRDPHAVRTATPSDGAEPTPLERAASLRLFGAGFTLSMTVLEQTIALWSRAAENADQELGYWMVETLNAAASKAMGA